MRCVRKRANPTARFSGWAIRSRGRQPGCAVSQRPVSPSERHRLLTSGAGGNHSGRCRRWRAEFRGIMAYTDRATQLEYQRRWIAARREKYVTLHGACCVKCGSGDRLEFDHVIPGSKIDHRIWSWAESRIQAELQKCQLLCRACHEAKTYAESGWTERPHGTHAKYVKDGCRCHSCRAGHAAMKRQTVHRQALKKSVGNGIAVTRA